MDTLQGAERVTTFADKAKIDRAFINHSYGLVIMVGRPGLSKSYTFEQRIKKGFKAFVFKGSASPYVAYRLCYENKDKPLILDDAEQLWSEREGRVLLRSLTEMVKPCTVQWAKKRQDDAPVSFKTNSPVMMLCNKFTFGHQAEFAAIVDRGHLFVFDPSATEVHKHAEWFDDEEIYEYIGERLAYLPDLSFRTYVRAAESKKAKRDWRKQLMASIDEHDRLLIDLELNEEISPAERVAAWIEGTGKCRATYFNRKAHLCRHGEKS